MESKALNPSNPLHAVNPYNPGPAFNKLNAPPNVYQPQQGLPSVYPPPGVVSTSQYSPPVYNQARTGLFFSSLNMALNQLQVSRRCAELELCLNRMGTEHELQDYRQFFTQMIHSIFGLDRG